MTEVVFYEKPRCLTNAKQKRLLVAHGHRLTVRDLLTEPWSAERLCGFFSGSPVQTWFNARAPRVRDGSLDIGNLCAEEALALMVADPLLIRRPLIETRAGRCTGFERGPVLRDRPRRYVSRYRELATTDEGFERALVGDDGHRSLIVFFLSAYGSTARMADAVRAGAESVSGVRVSLHDLEGGDTPPFVDLIEQADGLVMGSPTVNGDAVKPIWDLLDGWNNLTEPSVLEEKVLRENMASRHDRLACQAQIIGDCTVKPA